MAIDFEKLLNVRRSELRPASLLFLFLFLSIGSYIIGLSVGLAMFLNTFPNGLPHVIMATALVVAGFISVYIRISARVGLENLVTGSLVFFGVSFFIFWGMTFQRGQWVYALIYVWVGMAGAMAPSMGWTLANYLLTAREARRVFGFIGAGQVLGAPVAGFFTAWATRHVRPETLVPIIGVSMILCAVLTKLLFRQPRPEMLEVTRPRVAADIPKNFRQIVLHILRTRFLLLITALTAFGCAATTIIGYQFSIIAKQTFHNKADLAAFFALFSGFAGVAAFVLQMLVTGRLLRSFGIRVTLFILPVVFLGGSAALLIFPSIIAACFLKGSHSLLRFSVDKSSTELLYLPVSPPEIKNQIKPFIDGFVWRAADGIAGLVLWLFASGLKFSPARMSLVNLGFLGGWLAMTYGVRKEYLNVLKKAIETRTLDPERVAMGVVLDSTTVDVLAQALERGGEQKVLYGLSLFEVGRQTGWHPALRRLLEHNSPAVRHRALRLLSDAGDKGIVEQVEKMLKDPALEVRSEALNYLVTETGGDPLVLMSEATDLPDYAVQGAIVVYLARSGQVESFGAARMILDSMLGRSDADRGRARLEAARVLGLIPPPCELHTDLLALLADEQPEVAEQALLAAGKIGSPEFLPQVIRKLSDPRLRGPARAALAHYGARALGNLRACLNDASLPLELRKRIPDALAAVPTAESAAALVEGLVESNPGLRYDVLKALNKVARTNRPLFGGGEEVADMLEAELMGYYRSFQILAAIDRRAGAAATTGEEVEDDTPLLSRAVRERMDHELERIFRLLSLLYPGRDVYNAYLGLTSGDARLQANSLEVLEHVLKSDLYRRLISSLDPEVGLTEKLKIAEQICLTAIGSRAEALRILLHSDDLWLSACAIYTVGKLRLKELEADLAGVKRDADPLLTETWTWTRERLNSATSA